MIRNFLAVWAVAAVTGSAWGQDAFPYVGEITGAKVNVRCGATLNYPEMIRLDAPARVTVIGRENDFLKIQPPAGVYSLISKRYVQVDGAAGTITGDNVQVRAGSDLQPTAVSIVQARLNRGDRVSVTGSTEEYYKIAPPSGVAAYVHADYVRRADGAPTVVAPPTAAPIATAPVVEAPATRPAVAATRPTTPAAAATQPDTFSALVQQFEAAEAVLKAEYDKPVEQRDLAKVLALYKAINAPADSDLSQYVDWRIQTIQQVMQTAQAAQEAQKRIAEAEAEQRRRAAERAAIRVESTPAPSPGFTVTGRLYASTLYDGSGSLPKRWTVRDDATGAIVAFAECKSGSLDLAGLEGYLVKLRGRRYLPSGHQIFVLDVDRVEKLPGEAKPLPTAMEIRNIEPPRHAAPPEPPAPPPSPAPEPTPPAPPAAPSEAPSAPEARIPAGHVAVSLLVPRKVVDKADLLTAVLGAAEYNDRLSPHEANLDYARLEPGKTVLFLVPRELVEPITRAAAVQQAKLEAAANPAPAATMPAGRAGIENGYYVVQEGDAGLWGISQKVYGDGKYWYVIAKANPDLNPMRLEPGQRLATPSLETAISTTAPETSPAEPAAAPLPANGLPMAPTNSRSRAPVNAEEYD